MSKIDDVINSIVRYLEGNDQSNTPQICNAVKIYAQACSEVNAHLAECRQLIARGLLMDARHLDLEMNPPLSARAEKLLLTDEQYSRLIELCQLYNYDQPQKIDKDVINQLLKGVGTPDKNLQESILRWRKIARTGTLFDKIKTLRAILKNSPEDDQIWRNNLRTVEHQWISEMLKEADEALQNDNGEKLNQLYMRLTDPALLQPLPPEVLQKYQPAVKKYQQMLLDKELQKKRNELFDAYSKQNPELVENRLREYDLLVSNPLYIADIEAEQAVQDVRLYLKQYQENLAREREFAQKNKELISALNDHADFALIENLYESLRQLDLPLDQTLSLRVARRREECLSEKGRRHFRKCVYGILAAILILALGGLTFTVIQRTRSYLTYRDSMEKLLANDNYDGVITLHEKISKTTPVLLQFGRLTGMKLEAERLKKLRDERIENIKKLFEACFKEIAQAEPRLSEMKYLQGEIAKLRTDDLPSDMITQLQNINFKVRNLEFQAKRKNEDSFVASEEKLMNELEQLAQKMNDPSENPQLIRSRINDIINRMNTLNRQASDIDKKLRQERSGLINSRAQTLLTQLDNIAKRREIIRNLHTPDTFFKYMEELKNLSAQAPDLAIGEWKEALRQLPTVQGLYAGASLGNNYLTHQALEQKLSGIAVDMQNNCFVKDITMMLPDKYFRDNLKQVQDRLYAEFAMLYNCYELVFQDENNALWRFYSTEKPIFDRSYSSNTPKAIEINVLKKPGTPGYPLPITVSYKSKSKVAFIPDKLPGIALPVKFVKLVNVPVTSIRYPKAEHYELLAELLRELKRVKTPEALESCIIQILQKLQNSDNMNIFARAALTRKTLDILPLVTPFYAQLTSESNIALDRSALHLYENWYNPAAEIEHATAAGELRKFFKNFSPEKLQKTCHFMRKVYMQSQNRGLSPGGIILRTAHKRAKVHWFTGAKHVQEMWFYAPPAMGESPRWIMFTQKDLTNGNSLTMTRFAGYTGMVFFVPFDEQSTVNLTKQILRQQQAEKLLEFTWPACWPQNYR